MTIALLAAALVSLCHAQPQAPTTESQARYYVYGAFLTQAVPEIMGPQVALGPELEQRLGIAPGADRRRIYEALMTYTDGKPLNVRKATADDVANYKRNLKQPVFRVEAGDITLLVEYDMQANTIPFVGQLGVAYQPTAPVAAPRAAPVRPPMMAVRKPPATKPVPPPPAPAPELLKPNGPCVVQAVMSEQDLANCRAAAASAARVAPPPPPPPPAPKPQASIAPQPPAPAPARTGPCEVKPVMTEEELANCRAAPLTRVDPGPPAVVKPQAVRAEPQPRRTGPCEVKPVMTEEDLANCRSAPVTKVDPGPPAVVKPQAVRAEPQPRRTGPCEVKPVMTEEDLANCRSASDVATKVDPGAPPAPRPAGASQPEPKPAATPCVVKPVMSEEDLIACGIRR